MLKIAANFVLITQLKTLIQLCIAANVKQVYMQGVMVKDTLKTLTKTGHANLVDLNLDKLSLAVSCNRLFKVSINV
jgi:hypothetical protein